MSAKEVLANVVSSMFEEGSMSEEVLMAWSRVMESMTDEGLLPIFQEEGLYLQVICVK